MKAIQVKSFGEPEVMEYVDIETPTPKKNEVLVKVEAVGINPVDTYIRAGVYPVLPNLPYTPGKDISGVVESIGAGVTQWKEGDRVYASGTITGAYAEYALCTPEQLYPLPENVDFIGGAALGVPPATAWRALFTRGKVKPGESVLIHGASGSVGSAAVQFAKAFGLKVYGTASTIGGLAKLEKYKVHGLYNHRDPGYIEQLKKDVPGGFNIILEMLANVNLENDLTMLASKGRVIVIGSRGKIEIDPRATMGKETEVRGLALFNASQEELAEAHAAIFAAVESGVYTPAISTTLSLVDAPESHVKVMESGNSGKIVLTP